jgi:hypothetical protein
MSLLKKGVVVVPILDPDKLSRIRRKINKAVNSAPYFNPDSKNSVRTFGKFSGYSDPCSFWHPYIRKLRMKIVRRVRRFLAEIFPGWLCCAIPDRLLIREIGVDVKGDEWHRDVTDAKFLNKDWCVFGGYTNLNNEEMYFRCVKKSHRNERGKIYDLRKLKAGFAKLDKKDHPEYESSASNIKVPPGHHVIFFQHIIHTVIKYKNKIKLYRLYTGFMVTRAEEKNNASSPVVSHSLEYPLGGTLELKRMLKHQDVPIMCTGKKFPIYYSNHLRMYKNRPFKANPSSDSVSLLEHFTTMYTPEYLEAFSKDGVAPMYMPSMREMHKKLGYNMLEPVDDEEIFIPSLL